MVLFLLTFFFPPNAVDLRSSVSRRVKTYFVKLGVELAAFTEELAAEVGGIKHRRVVREAANQQQPDSKSA